MQPFLFPFLKKKEELYAEPSHPRMAEDTRIPFSRAAGWAGSLADKPVVLCSVVFFVGPYKVLSLPRDPMTGSPPSLALSLTQL